ncbi:hypothetical protein [Streptomyces sp. SPB162]|uniref:hypothetical protein n=1 Tax=Streptomyces sp. SPB162 TaxID=2940560 RepID=UPI0024062CF6|nr:hypothetical protein [Streptomyces sp. SPB162]MDF9815841.1 hypothetical protein [Streptomyces sp. SPB162]
MSSAAFARRAIGATGAMTRSAALPWRRSREAEIPLGGTPDGTALSLGQAGVLHVGQLDVQGAEVTVEPAVPKFAVPSAYSDPRSPVRRPQAV